MVEYLTHNPKIEGLNLAARSKMVKKFCCGGITVVEHLTHNPKIEGLNPSVSPGREKRTINVQKNYTVVVAQW